jgi:regulatory protein
MVPGKIKDLGAAKISAFRLLKFRSRSEKEITSRLKKKGFSPKIIEEVIRYLKGLDLIDDFQFALSWVNSRINRPLGLRRLTFELAQKGVDKDIINKVIDKTKEKYDEYEIVKTLAQAKFKKSSGLDIFKAKRKVYAYLLRRGFSQETISEVVQNL